MLAKYLIFLPIVLGAQSSSDLTVTMVGNAGVVLSDGTTSLLVDLPYQSGAHGYDQYQPGELRPVGDVVAVITHHHTDHFDSSIFVARDSWRIVGPESVTSSLPRARVVLGDSVRIGAFDVIAVPTPHTPDHRSYRVRWQGRIFLFTGDTDSPAELLAGPRGDILFATSWFSCRAGGNRMAVLAERVIEYHRTPSRDYSFCGEVERLQQGVTFTVTAN